MFLNSDKAIDHRRTVQIPFCYIVSAKSASTHVRFVHLGILALHLN